MIFLPGHFAHPSRHADQIVINNALKEELADEVVVANFATTTQHGAIEGKTQTHEKEYFNLEMVTSVGPLSGGCI